MTKQFAALMAAAAIGCSATTVYAAPQQIILEVSHSQLLRVTNANIIRVAIANPAIADVVVFDKGNINMIGKEAGSTTLMVWTSDGMRQDFTITVSPIDTGSAEAIKASMHLPEVEVEKVGDKILLTGFVEDQTEMEIAESVASLYVEGEWEEQDDFTALGGNGAKFTKRVHKNIINKIQMRNPKQINLAILVLDVPDNDVSKWGIQYANATNVDGSNSGNPVTVSQDINSFYGGMSYWRSTGRLFADVNGFVQALTTTTTGKVLSRPNITTMSGQEANILIGGQLPVSTLKDGEVTIGWKDYGIRMHIKPTVDSDGKILTRIDSEVSSLDPAHAVTNSAGTIPALTTRHVSTTVVVPSGETMAIGGLVNNIDSKTVRKFPILGDLPIIGEFFKHTSREKDKRELVLLITPTLVQPENAGKVKVGERLLREMEQTKREMEQRKTFDVNSIPNPNGGSGEKK